MRRFGIAACTLAAFAASAASAGVLLTGPMKGGAGRNPVCRLVNLGTKPVKGVRITAFRTPVAMPGALYAESPVFELDPLQSYVLGQIEPLESPDNFACVFEFAGSGKTLRGSIAVFDGENLEVASEPAR
jgi:hypothetical protein